jgi:acyl carrier protein
MSDSDILSGLAAIVNEVSGRPADTVVPTASFAGDLDLDSLTMVEVVVAAEEKFGVRIPDDDVADLVTVQDAIDYITRAAVAA